MNTIKRRLIDDFRAMARDRRGSALLVSLMVMVGLSLLGLSFVAISETETAIASHERDSSQALDAAESGAKMVVEWFQDPSWAKTNHFLPNNDPALKTARTIAGGIPGNDYYKGLSSADLLFDTPYTVQNGRFYGDEAHADVIINYSNSTGLTFLNSLNALMFTTDANVGSGATAAIEGGGVRITEIRVYAPPVIGGTFDTTTGFWGTIGSRYGLATIKVTASKFGPTEVKKTDLSTATPLATRFVKIIVNQWPFPGPQGPIQSNANIQTGGNFGVHWGRMTAQGDMDIKIPLVGLNWFDAWDHPHFEHGYDSSDPWQPAHAYAVDEVVHPSTGPNGNSYICTAAGTSGAAAAEPAWSTFATGTTISDAGALRWKVRGYPALYPNTVSASSPTQIDQYNWLYELINKTYEDPWFEARARGDITNATSLGNNSIQPYPYQDWTLDETNAPSAGYSNWFQKQTTTIPKSSQMKQVIFPRIDYDFWKDIAVTGAGTQNVFYLQWVSADQFTDGITTKGFAKWVNTVTGATPGYYFFDTQNKQNPQGAGAPGTLTPAFTVNSADDGHILQMAGFIYLNAAEFGTTGIGGPDGYQNYPGEPYRDVGYQLVSKTTGGSPAQTRGRIFIGPGGTVAPYDGANNNTRDWEDL
ncbi:MAG TPA: pilus assembly PilX N-terminal domain-containing protein, partial [Vicinamibacterales bacterium]